MTRRLGAKTTSTIASRMSRSMSQIVLVGLTGCGSSGEPSD